MRLQAVLFSAAFFLGATAQAKVIVCDYSAFLIATGIEVKQQFKLDVTSNDGATNPLQLGKFGNLDGSAWALGDALVIVAKRGDTMFSSTDTLKANLRHQTQDGIYEAFCRLE